MISDVFLAWSLLAQNGGPPPVSGLQSAMPLFTIVAIFVLYIMVIHRPAMRREQQARQAMLAGLKKNDRVITSSGIYGVVTSVQADADEVTIRVDEASNAKLRLTLSAIARVLGEETGAEAKKEAK